MSAPMVFPGQDPSDHGATGWSSPMWGEIYTGTSPNPDALTPELPGAVPAMPRYDAGVPSPYQLMADAAAAGQEINLNDMA